ncbi:aminotransferase-like domain-containing protein [Paractinoplanes hotanensis]|uniref:PLP-dependent aminotransferase family protein n=1 Tax=Paractinoplanes hotanensis TaxID=2906497 RepID=A0ABT0Y2N4_9ACTN|nr:PLP-dependent aminotransferase family protein [Actinoplanes hotanensis]MCM4080302.1 PLP-dependent aminotransferase family protein [Actinoplanes hotanensis]
MTIVQFEHRPGILDLGWGHPRPALLPLAEWSQAGAQSIAAHGWQALTYGHAPGPAPLIDWLCAHVGDAAADQTFVTAGASHGLALLTQLLAEPGDTVLVDSPTYHLAFKIFTDHGVRLVPAPADEHGLLPAETAALARSLDAAFLYLVPTFGNPTGRSLPPGRRRELVCQGLTIIEDDTYRELYYGDAAPPALWQLAEQDGVIRLGSFAKTVAPGLRLGWINASPFLVDRLTRLGYVHSGGGVNHSVAMTMAAYGSSGAYAKHVAALRGRYRDQRDALTGALGTPPPDGGWFVWLPLPPHLDAATLLPVAERHGVSFVPGTAFYAGGRGGSDRVRLSFSHLSPADLAQAAARLGAAIAATGR